MALSFEDYKKKWHPDTGDNDANIDKSLNYFIRIGNNIDSIKHKMLEEDRMSEDDYYSKKDINDIWTQFEYIYAQQIIPLIKSLSGIDYITALQPLKSNVESESISVEDVYGALVDIQKHKKRPIKSALLNWVQGDTGVRALDHNVHTRFSHYLVFIGVIALHSYLLENKLGDSIQKDKKDRLYESILFPSLNAWSSKGLRGDPQHGIDQPENPPQKIDHLEKLLEDANRLSNPLKKNNLARLAIISKVAHIYQNRGEPIDTINKRNRIKLKNRCYKLVNIIGVSDLESREIHVRNLKNGLSLFEETEKQLEKALEKPAQNSNKRIRIKKDYFAGSTAGKAQNESVYYYWGKPYFNNVSPIVTKECDTDCTPSLDMHRAIFLRHLPSLLRGKKEEARSSLGYAEIKAYLKFLDSRKTTIIADSFKILFAITKRRAP